MSAQNTATAEIVEAEDLEHEQQQQGKEVAQRSEHSNVLPSGSALTPMEMLDRALASGAGLDMIEKLMGLQERWEANQARKAFNEAFAAFKAEAITVVRNRTVTDGPLKGRRYAELTSFVEAATPAMSRNGLSASWDITRDDKDWIEVTCTIEHTLGGNKKVSLGGPPDAGGAKNALQARISTVTYLERATFKAAAGLAEQGDDDDGAAAGRKADQEPISKAQAGRIRKELEDAGSDLVKFCTFYKIDKLEDLPSGQFAGALRMIADAKAARDRQAAEAARKAGGEA